MRTYHALYKPSTRKNPRRTRGAKANPYPRARRARKKGNPLTPALTPEDIAEYVSDEGESAASDFIKRRGYVTDEEARGETTVRDALRWYVLENGYLREGDIIEKAQEILKERGISLRDTVGAAFPNPKRNAVKKKAAKRKATKKAAKRARKNPIEAEFEDEDIGELEVEWDPRQPYWDRVRKMDQKALEAEYKKLHRVGSSSETKWKFDAIENRLKTLTGSFPEERGWAWNPKRKASKRRSTKSKATKKKAPRATGNPASQRKMKAFLRKNPGCEEMYEFVEDPTRSGGPALYSYFTTLEAAVAGALYMAREGVDPANMRITRYGATSRGMMFDMGAVDWEPKPPWGDGSMREWVLKTPVDEVNEWMDGDRAYLVFKTLSWDEKDEFNDALADRQAEPNPPKKKATKRKVAKRKATRRRRNPTTSAGIHQMIADAVTKDVESAYKKKSGFYTSKALSPAGTLLIAPGDVLEYGEKTYSGDSAQWKWVNFANDGTFLGEGIEKTPGAAIAEASTALVKWASPLISIVLDRVVKAGKKTDTDRITKAMSKFEVRTFSVDGTKLPKVGKVVTKKGPARMTVKIFGEKPKASWVSAGDVVYYVQILDDDGKPIGAKDGKKGSGKVGPLLDGVTVDSTVNMLAGLFQGEDDAIEANPIQRKRLNAKARRMTARKNGIGDWIGGPKRTVKEGPLEASEVGSFEHAVGIPADPTAAHQIGYYEGILRGINTCKWYPSPTGMWDRYKFRRAMRQKYFDAINNLAVDITQAPKKVRRIAKMR